MSFQEIGALGGSTYEKYRIPTQVEYSEYSTLRNVNFNEPSFTTK